MDNGEARMSVCPHADVTNANFTSRHCQRPRRLREGAVGRD